MDHEVTHIYGIKQVDERIHICKYKTLMLRHYLLKHVT